MERRFSAGGLHPNGEAQESEDLVVAAAHALDSEVLHLGRAGDVGEEARDAVLAVSLSTPGRDRLGVDRPVDIIGYSVEDRLNVSAAEGLIDPLDRGREVQRVEKTLQDAGIKLSSVASEVLGKSARLMLDAMISGTHDPELLAELAKGALRKKIPALREALEGRFTGHHALLVGQMLAQIDFLDETIATLSERVEELTRPFSREIELLDTIPGVDKRAAEMLLAEIGPDMSRFPTDAHLASWGGMCPGQRESGGKKHSAATRKGSKWLRGTLTESSKAVVRTKGTYLSARYHRIKSRRGHAKATVATAHKILTAAYHVLDKGVPYNELGEEFFYRRDTENTERYKRRLVHQLERLGHQVTLEPLPEAA